MFIKKADESFILDVCLWLIIALPFCVKPCVKALGGGRWDVFSCKANVKKY